MVINMKSKRTKKRYDIYVCMMLIMGSIFLGFSGCAAMEDGKTQASSVGEADITATEGSEESSTKAAEGSEEADAMAAEGNGEIREAGALPEIKITFFDVGKGDAILIETAEHKLMIDAGYEDTAEILLGYFKEQRIGKLDYLVLTHFDKDHVGGADHVLEAVEVGEVLQPDYQSDGKQYEEYEKAMEELGKEPMLVDETMRMSLDGAEILIYPPQRKEYEEEDNDFSLVISMVYGEKSFLFAGDCEKERLKELLGQEEFSLSHNMLKVPHHGRKEKNSAEFFEAVSPDVAVITCSEEKPADGEVVEMLEGLGTDIYFSTDGTVACFCDGENFRFF